MKSIIKKGLVAVSASLLLLAASGTAHAVAPANSVVTNTASLTYTGLTTPLTASVDIKIQLVSSTPSLPVTPPADITVADGTQAVVPYTLTATGNGPETFNLTAAATPNANVTPGTAPVFTDPATGLPITSITLGATAPLTNAAVGATSLTVPSDGTTDGQVNGLATGDTVIIGGVPYTIAGVVDNPTGTSTITLTTPLTVAVPAGTLIAEQAPFNLVLQNAGTTTTPGTPAFTDVLVTATPTGTATPAAASTDTVRVNLTSVTFVKYVANITNANGPGGAGVLVGGTTYYPTAGLVTAATGDVLQYYMKVTAPVGTAVPGAVLVDDVPAFTTYVANSTTLNGAPVADIAAASPLTTLNGGLTVNSPAAAAGTIAAGASAEVTFQVTVQ